MRVCVCSLKEKEREIALRTQQLEKIGKGFDDVDCDAAGWRHGGNDISYGPSKLNNFMS